MFSFLLPVLFDDSHRASPDTLQRVFTPIRVYYRLMRWIYGQNYDPFTTNITEGLHPIPEFLKQNDFWIRVAYYTPIYAFPVLIIIFIHIRLGKK